MIDLEANQHMNKMENIVIGQGVFKNNFSGKTPILGLTLDDKLYRYPLYQISPTKYISEIFYPLELRDLSKASIIYQDSTINQFSININSRVIEFVLLSKLGEAILLDVVK